MGQNHPLSAPRNGPISAWFFAEVAAQKARWNRKPAADVGITSWIKTMDFSDWLSAASSRWRRSIFIISGGELGGKKTVEGDQDLPPVATASR